MPGIFEHGPAEIAAGRLCWPQRTRKESRHAELLSAWRVAKTKLLQRFIALWHGTALWMQHCRIVAAMASVRWLAIPEPNAEPDSLLRRSLKEALGYSGRADSMAFGSTLNLKFLNFIDPKPYISTPYRP